MKKSERLNQELIFLSNKKYFNLEDLIKEFKISKRTALRDIQDLEAMGLSLSVENGRYGGYQIISRDLITPIYFDSAEISSIFFALKALNLVSNTPFEKSYSRIFQKLLATLPKDQEKYISKLLEIVSYHNISPLNSVNYLSLILEAILENKILKINYTQYKNSEKIIQPYDLFYRNGIWFSNSLNLISNSWEVLRCDYIKECDFFSEDKYKALSRKDLSSSLKTHRISYYNIPFSCQITNFGKEIFLKNNYHGMNLVEENKKIYIKGFFSKNEISYLVHYFIGFANNIYIESPDFLRKAYLKELNKILEQY